MSSGFALEEFAGAIGKYPPVQRHDLRDVGNGLFGQAGLAGSEPDIARRIRPAKVAGQRHADGCAQSAAVEGVTLNDDHWHTKAWA